MIKKNNLTFSTKRKIFLNRFGEHNSIFSGNGLEFEELREYVSGDDVRHINAKVTAKTRVAHVNVFNEDKRLNILSVFLNSDGIYFGSKRSKQDTMAEILGNLCWASSHKQDLMSVLFYSEFEQLFVKPTKDKQALWHTVETALDLNPLGNRIEYDKLSQYLLQKIKKKSIIFLIGDFLDYGDFRLLGAKHEVFAIIVRDRLEEDIAFVGEVNLKSTNNKASGFFKINSKLKNQYALKMKQHDDKLYKNLIASNIRYQKIYTSDDVVKKLQKLLRN